MVTIAFANVEVGIECFNMHFRMNSVHSIINQNTFFGHLLCYRLQTIYRLAHGGRSYKIDIYLRNWSIRTELQRRAYLYNIENESFHQPESSVPAGQSRNESDDSMLVKLPHKLNITATSDGLNRLDIEIYQNSSNKSGRNHKRGSDMRDSSYHKQYCNEMKTLQSKVMTESKDINSDALLCYNCNCSERKGGRNAATTAALTTNGVPTNGMEVVKKQQKQCSFNPMTTCEIGKANKPPKLKTRNTFISRLFLTDIFDNI